MYQRVAQVPGVLATRRSGRAGLYACSLALAACSFALDVDDDQCTIDADCMVSGLGGTCSQGVCVAASASTASPCIGSECGDDGVGESGGATVCGGVVCPQADALCFHGQCASQELVAPFMCDAEQPAPTHMIPVELYVEEYVKRNRPLAGLHITACLAMDVFCDSPVTRAVDAEATGILRFQVPYGFEGYFMIESDVTMPFVMEFTKALVEPLINREVRVADYKTIEQLTAVTSAPVDLEQGIVIVEAYDCQGGPQGGVHFKAASAAALPFYLVNLLPNLEATTTVHDETSGYAVGGFFNVPPGLVLITAEVGVDGPMIDTHNAHVRSGAMTFLDVRR